MAIIFIEGPAKSGKSFLGNALRNNQISKKHGGLLVDEDQDGDPKILLEKILKGFALPDFPLQAKDLPWKDEATIVFIGEKKALLSEFEQLTPGITQVLGPVFNVTTA